MSPAAFVENVVGFVPARIDLGTQPWASVLPLELEFINGGESPLTIASISTSCNCAVFDSAAMEGRLVAPGETLQVSGSLETSLHAGTLARSVPLTTKDERQFVATLFVEVTGSWAISADSVNFGDVVCGPAADAPTMQSIVFTPSGDDLKESPSADVDWVEVSTTGLESGATRIDLRVRSELLRPGIRTGQLIVRTSSAIRPECSIYLRARGVASLLAMPTPVFLEPGARQRVSFRRPDGTPAKIFRATSDDERLSVEIVGDDQIAVSELAGRTGPVACSRGTPREHEMS